VRTGDDLAMSTLLERQLLFVTGKGGVGKTTTAAALADLAARSGKRVLVCEMDAKGALAASFEVATLGFEPREVRQNLFAMAMNTEDSLREYLRVVARIPLVGRIGPLARTFDFVADAAPGVKEILAIGKVCFEVRERHYDLVVVDAEASGHIVAQIDAPRAIRELVQVGPVRDQTEWMLGILGDATRTGLVVVTTPEEMPITETVELVEKVRSTTEVDVAAVVVNRVLPRWFEGREAAVFDRLGGSVAQEVLARAVGPKVATVFDAARLADARRSVVETHLARLRADVPADVPVVQVPELFTKASGSRVVTLVADELAQVLP
jgi:anion-transporting  ArsA/GET3 family ATPase